MKCNVERLYTHNSHERRTFNGVMISGDGNG